MISHDIYIHSILLFVSILETENIASSHCQTNPTGHDDIQNQVVATKSRNTTQQEHTTHLLSAIGLFMQ